MLNFNKCHSRSLFKLLPFCICNFLVGLCSTVYAQKEVTLCEVTIKGVKPERFMVGQKIILVDSSKLAINRFSTLADFLQYQAPIAFKSYGAGQLSSISFRGTSSNHTALLWNGININFPSLGQTDFSTVPVSGFDEMSVQFGSSASCVGTDAVGGSILLRSTPDFRKNGLQFNIGTKVESSRNYSLQIGGKYAQILSENWKFSGKTLLYGSVVNNDFGTEPIQNKSGQRYNVEPAQTLQKGLIQDIYFQQKNGNSVSFNTWITENNLVIQPDNIKISEVTNTKAFRSLLSYQIGKTLLKSGFIRDITDYGVGENLNPSHTEIDRYIVRVEHDFSWIKDCQKGTNLKIGSEFVHYDAKVDSYSSSSIQENRYDIYALLRYQFSMNLSASVNLRQAFVTKFNPPFTPSFGVEYTVFRSPNWKITLPVNVAFSYRVPTLNERYWAKLGNPDIKPEKGFNKEMGIDFVQNENNRNTKFGVAFFHNLIDNWTYWNPDKGYRVENLQQVLSKGIELDLGINRQFSKTNFKLDLQYAYTNASQQKAFGAYTSDILGKQLIYVPRHVVSSTVSVNYQNIGFNVQQQFNSARAVTFDHSGYPFPPFYLLNTQLFYKHIFKNNQFDFAFQTNNLTNTLYPNLKKNAMPMRSFSINLFYHLQSN